MLQDEKLKRAKAQRDGTGGTTTPLLRVEPQSTDVMGPSTQTYKPTDVNVNTSTADIPQPQQPVVQAPQATLPAQPQPDVPTKGPSVAYYDQAQDYNTRASNLETQARPAQPSRGVLPTLLRGVSEGLQGAAFPGGYGAWKQVQTQNERQRQQDLLTRAKEYRGEAQKEEQLGLTEEQRQVENRRADAAARAEADKTVYQMEDLKLRRAMLQREIDKDNKLKPGVDVPFSPDVAEQQMNIRAASKTPPQPKEYGANEYIADQENKLGRVLTPQERQDAAVKFKSQPGVIVQTVKGDEARKTGDFATARKEVAKALEDYQNYDTNYKTMKDAADRVTSGKSQSPGVDDMVVLFRHIGMTIGAVKGGRVNNVQVQQHLDALPLTDRFRVMYERLKSGQQLSPDQRQEMLEIGRSNREARGSQYEDTANYYGWRPDNAPRYTKAPDQSSRPETNVGVVKWGRDAQGHPVRLVQ